MYYDMLLKEVEDLREFVFFREKRKLPRSGVLEGIMRNYLAVGKNTIKHVVFLSLGTVFAFSLIRLTFNYSFL
jgi:hypothetical protein